MALEDLLKEITETTRPNQQLCLTLKYEMSIAYMHGHSDQKYAWTAEVVWRPGNHMFFRYGDAPEDAIRNALSDLKAFDVACGNK